MHPDWLAIGVEFGDGTFFVYASRDVHRINIEPVMAHRPIPLDGYTNDFVHPKVSSIAVKGWLEDLVIGRGQSYAEAFAAIDDWFRDHPASNPALRPAPTTELRP